MSYDRFIPAEKTHFQVNDSFIEVGTSTWQIRNIAATSIDKKVIPFMGSKPKFKLSFLRIRHILFAILASSLAFFILWNFYPILLFEVVAAFFSFFAVFVFSSIKKHQLLCRKWQDMVDNPLIFYSLMLETNAGSKPLFFSFNYDQIMKANNYIKLAMERKDMNINFDIDSVNVGGEGSINNFGSNIYEQVMRNAI